ncbi:hypothetical protein D3C80_681390 [compost metagenome]
MIFSARMVARSRRVSSEACTRIGICRSSSEIFVSWASISPMVATRTVCEICCGVMPRRAISSLRGRICSSGRGNAPSELTLARMGEARRRLSRMPTASFRSFSLVERKLKESSRSARSFSLMMRTSGMPRTCAKISRSTSHCGRTRPFSSTFGRYWPMSGMEPSPLLTTSLSSEWSICCRMTLTVARRSSRSPLGDAPPRMKTLSTPLMSRSA